MSQNYVDTVEEILKKVGIIISEKKGEIEIPALKELEGAMKQRIHNKGLDSNGDKIGIKGALLGKYTKAYERRKTKGGNFNKRRYAGSGEEHIYPINLQLHGDLLKDFTVGVKDGVNVLEFQTELAAKKVERHETTYKTKIYEPSKKDQEGFREVLLTQVGEVLRKNFKK